MLCPCLRAGVAPTLDAKSRGTGASCCCTTRGNAPSPRDPALGLTPQFQPPILCRVDQEAPPPPRRRPGQRRRGRAALSRSSGLLGRTRRASRDMAPKLGGLGLRGEEGEAAGRASSANLPTSMGGVFDHDRRRPMRRGGRRAGDSGGQCAAGAAARARRLSR